MSSEQSSPRLKNSTSPLAAVSSSPQSQPAPKSKLDFRLGLATIRTSDRVPLLAPSSPVTPSFGPSTDSSSKNVLLVNSIENIGQALPYAAAELGQDAPPAVDRLSLQQCHMKLSK